MAREPIGLISHQTIGRSSSKRRDDAGLPIEESVPSLRSVVMYDGDGNELRIPTHCHRAFVPAFDDKYKPRLMRDRLEDGFLESGRCPHMPREQLNDQPSVKAPAGFTTCDGKGEADPDTLVVGCSHLKAVVAERRKRAAAKAANRKNPAAKAATLAVAQKLAEAAVGNAHKAVTRKAPAERVSE